MKIDLSAIAVFLIPAYVLSCPGAQGQSGPDAASGIIVQPQPVRALPGGLDTEPMFNSNSPEVVHSDGILLSTFPPEGKQHPEAHLNYPLSGKFTIFAHHINKAISADDPKTLYLGILVHNPNKRNVKLKVLEAATYLSQPDAPFINLPPLVENREGNVYAGPGDRVTSEILRGRTQKGWQRAVSIAPGESKLLASLPVPVANLSPPLNGRTALIRLQSARPVYVACLSTFATGTADGCERAPLEKDFQDLLQTGPLSGPRDKTPTTPGAAEKVVYGRVAGVARGCTWRATIKDDAGPKQRLQIPSPGKSVSYVLSTVDRGTLGTQQVQSAPLSVRYSDTAYQAHGNYCVAYRLRLPFYNSDAQTRHVSLSVQTPIKDDLPGDGLKFFRAPPNRVHFRGSIRVAYRDDDGKRQARFVHLVQNQGQEGLPLVTLSLTRHKRRFVDIEFLYPPDSTPPQVITIKTADAPD